MGSCRNELNRLPRHDRRDGAEVEARRSKAREMSDDASAGVALGSKHGFRILGRAVRRRLKNVAR